MFSVREIPFSHRGSWFNLSPVIAEKTFAEDVHLVSHQTGMHPVLRFRVDGTVTATPSVLTWQGASGRVRAGYESPSVVRVRGDGLGLVLAAAAPGLTSFSGAYLHRDPASGAHVFTVYETGRRYRVTVLDGEIAATTGVQALGAGERSLGFAHDQAWEIAIEEYETARAPYRPGGTFDQVAAATAKTFAAFVDRIAPWRTEDTPAAELAAYVLWSATVDPGGFLTRPAVLMSKHWMDKVWSWDHCFNAIALAAGEPELAWDQFLLPFDHQDPSGALPDSVTHSEVLYNFVKPPIHGWALRRLRERASGATPDVYERLARWTRFWLDHRRAPGHVLPYYQHGNDSGWDNATTFDTERVVESADLSAFLILQLDTLAALAEETGRGADWATIAAGLRREMLGGLWQGDRFAARGVESGESHPSRSLLDLMPIILGADLPPAMSKVLAATITTHLTAYGPATEPVGSPGYEPDGYWRGPIWAPSTILIEDGLRRAGHTGLADEISLRFRRLCETSGFAENFDAETGAGLRDRAYTWTASAYLILAGSVVRNRAR